MTIASSIGSPCCTLAGFVHKFSCGKSESFAKYSGNLVQLLKTVNLQPLDILVSFDTVCRFTNIQVDEAVRNKLCNDNTGGTVCLAG
jgi:hypothetical protein